MKIKYGLYKDTFYVPIWFFGLMHGPTMRVYPYVTQAGMNIWALVFGKWYIGIEY